MNVRGLKFYHIFCIVTVLPLFCDTSLANTTIFKTVEKAIFQSDFGKLIINDGRPSPFDQHTVVFAIKQNNQDILDSLLQDISNPGHTKYGQYLTSSEIANLTIASDSILYVEKWLTNLGKLVHMKRLTPSGEYLSVTAPIWYLDYLFQTEFLLLKKINIPNTSVPLQASSESSQSSTQQSSQTSYSSSSSSASSSSSSTSEIIQAYRALSYSLPIDLIPHIAHVFHTIQHPFAAYHVRQHPISEFKKLKIKPKIGNQSNNVVDKNDLTQSISNKIKTTTDSITNNIHVNQATEKNTNKNDSNSKKSNRDNSNTSSSSSDNKSSHNDGDSSSNSSSDSSSGSSDSDEDNNQTPEFTYGGYMHPGILYNHYNIFMNYEDSNMTNKNNSNTNKPLKIPAQGIYASIGQQYSVNDLKLFEKIFEIPTEPTMKIHGNHQLTTPCYHPDDCFEANLDIQYLIAVGQNIPTYYGYEKDMSVSSFTFFLIDLNLDPDPPRVVSISYAICECVVSPMDKYFFDLEAKKLALKGVTIIAASGDAGASNAHSSSTCGYNPIYPASSIYVTAVGATQGPEWGEQDRACQMNTGGVITTGGGFSNIYAAPIWQQNAINTYFDTVLKDSSTIPYQDYTTIKKTNTHTHKSSKSNKLGENNFGNNDNSIENESIDDISHSAVNNIHVRSTIVQNNDADDSIPVISAYPNPLYNRYGRGYPDLSVAGVNYLVVVNSTFYALSGTSASSPVFAGMISLINAARQANSKSTLGWINPTLYQSNGIFADDILDGENICYGFINMNQCCREGFHGSRGWDPVTGWGAVNYRQLYQLFYNLPPGYMTLPTKQNTDSNSKMTFPPIHKSGTNKDKEIHNKQDTIPSHQESENGERNIYHIFTEMTKLTRYNDVLALIVIILIILILIVFLYVWFRQNIRMSRLGFSSIPGHDTSGGASNAVPAWQTYVPMKTDVSNAATPLTSGRQGYNNNGSDYTYKNTAYTNYGSSSSVPYQAVPTSAEINI